MHASKSKIKYICLSDLHLGSHSALLTDTPATDGTSGTGTSAGPLRDAFSAALIKTLETFDPAPQPEELPFVVLLGDIFDLSLGTPKSSIQTFGAFLDSLMNAGAGDAFGPFIFLPGNHDHELWTVTRFQDMIGASEADDNYVHTTPAFADPQTQPAAALMDRILTDKGFKPATTFYPNMGLRSDDNKRMVVLHHGHFVESMYRVMSTLTSLLNGSPNISFDAETLERLNSSWIDFIWSTDGDNGELGTDITRAFHALMTGRQDLRFDHRLADILAEKLAAGLPLPHTAKARTWTENAARAFVDSTLGNFSQMERFSYHETLGADSLAGLKTYISDTVQRQISDELPGAEVEDLTFIFGHTHKPFETRVTVPGFATPPAIYNTGGWDMDTPMFGTRLGGAAVFIDEDLNVASLRVCDVPQQADDAAPSKVRVVTADGTPDKNPLAQGLQRAVSANQGLWDAFSAKAAEAYRVKQAYIMEQHQTGNDRENETGGTS